MLILLCLFVCLFVFVCLLVCLLVVYSSVSMTIYNIYIFNSEGQCIYYWEWKRSGDSQVSQSEEFKLMYGMIFSIKSFINRLSPIDADNQFCSYATNKHRLHFFETQSKLKFILNTDLQADSAKVNELLKEIYTGYYVQFVVKNPFCDIRGVSIESSLFTKKLNAFISNLTIA